jgi:undecaprenyl-diphosphatase
VGGYGIAALAGIIQGVVEWLPVSSKTMITLLFAAGGYRFETGYVMGLLANFGSFFAALWYFRRDVVAALRGLRRPLASGVEARTLRFLVLATVATGVVGLPIYAGVTAAFPAAGGAWAMAGIGALLLVTSAISLQRERLVQLQSAAVQPQAAAVGSAAADEAAAGEVPGAWLALLVGACQGLAALPGISRSAVTVTPLVWSGRAAASALRLSFLLDVLALLAAGAVPLVVGHHGLAAVRAVGVGPTVLMVALSAVVSLFTIGAVLGIASRLRSSVITAAIGAVTIVAAILLPR